jgi:HlyD family secretion protein
VVLSRNVEIGQTVTSGLQTPTLFVIARDLGKMRVQANVDEADIGRAQVGQPVQFTVDAYGNEAFQGRVSQVRLQPLVAQNVVSYTTMIDVDNGAQKLKPGMTATVKIETGRTDDGLVVPAAALRFTPTQEMLQAMGNPPAGNDPQRASGDTRSAATAASGSANRQRGAGATAGQRQGGRKSTAVWMLVDGRLKRVRVQVTHSDGTRAAVVSPELSEGAVVVTGVATPQSVAAQSSQGGSPLVPTAPRPPGSGTGGAGRRGGF